MSKSFKYLLTIFVLFPLITFAHGLETTQSQISGNYDIEFEYNTLGSIVTGDYTLFDVYLLNKDTRQALDFDSVFIRIMQRNGLAVLSGNLAESAGIKGYASMGGIINNAGEYVTEVSFYQTGKILAEAKFNFNVEKNKFETEAATGKDSKFYWQQIAFVALGLILGAAGITLFRR